MSSATLLPANASPGEVALDSATSRIGDVPTPIRDLWNAQTCPEALLPWLAWALSIDTWNTSWPIAVKRARVASAISIQRRKGTSQSVRDVVAAFGGSIAIQEWWQQTPPGPPYTFNMALTVNGQGGEEASADFVNDILAEVDRTKPVRAHYTFTQGTALSTQLGVAAVARLCGLYKLSFYAQAAQ